MTLNAYGHQIELDAVKGAMKTSGLDPDNTDLSALDLMKFAEARGLGVVGIHAEGKNIPSVLATGDILHFDHQHFVVFDERRGRAIVILDPAEGQVEIDEQAFATEFSGTALLFAASPEALQRRKQQLGL